MIEPLSRGHSRPFFPSMPWSYPLVSEFEGFWYKLKYPPASHLLGSPTHSPEGTLTMHSGNPHSAGSQTLRGAQAESGGAEPCSGVCTHCSQIMCWVVCQVPVNQRPSIHFPGSLFLLPFSPTPSPGRIHILWYSGVFVYFILLGEC